MARSKSVSQLRREFYQGWVTRASDQGATDGRWDNTQLLAQILDLRHKVAQLVGYPNYAEYSLATKMASSVEEVRAFLEQLAGQSRPVDHCGRGKVGSG